MEGEGSGGSQGGALFGVFMTGKSNKGHHVFRFGLSVGGGRCAVRSHVSTFPTPEAGELNSAFIGYTTNPAVRSRAGGRLRNESTMGRK